MQVEGAFVMGLGEFLTENLSYSASGTLLSAGTFEYKPPFSLDIPQKLTVIVCKNIAELRCAALNPLLPCTHSVYF